jgi:AcrR family transcriptional regulator
MPRRRVHAPDTVLDAAEELLVERGRPALTIRALAERAAASNGSIYHAFGSLETVAAQAWLRRAQEFLALQRAAVDRELADGGADAGRRAVRAAADAPARYAAGHLQAARLLVSVQRDDLLTDAVADQVAGSLRALDGDLLHTLRLLAGAVFGRDDRLAVDVVTTCVVRLPAALLFPGIRAGEVPAIARDQLGAAVDAVLRLGPAA